MNTPTDQKLPQEAPATVRRIRGGIWVLCTLCPDWGSGYAAPLAEGRDILQARADDHNRKHAREGGTT